MKSIDGTMYEFNINDTCWVHLTDYGRKVWDYSWRHTHLCGVPAACIHTDNEGRTRFSIWELMRTFGAEMYNGAMNQCFVDNKIWFGRTDL